MSRNWLYHRACRVAYPWKCELWSWLWFEILKRSPLRLVYVDENAFTLVKHKRLISPLSFIGNYMVSRSPLFAVFVFFSIPYLCHMLMTPYSLFIPPQRRLTIAILIMNWQEVVATWNRRRYSLLKHCLLKRSLRLTAVVFVSETFCLFWNLEGMNTKNGETIWGFPFKPILGFPLPSKM